MVEAALTVDDNPGRLIVVSNRLPMSVTKSGGKLHFKPSAGGLATAMASVSATHDMLWIGWPGIAADKLTAEDRKAIRKELEQHHCYPVFLTQAQIERFYDGYSNATIWPLFHYFQGYAEHQPAYWTQYQKVNELFAATVAKLAQPTSTVWVHDYQLMLLPALIRSKLPDATIGYFHHIPFPSYEIYRLLPERTEVLKGLLGADLIGFHTYNYARHFLSSSLRLLGLESRDSVVPYDRRAVRADVFPIGIDYAKFARASAEPKTADRIKALNQKLGGLKIILSVDRLDYSKGIIERVEAIDALLSRSKRWHKKIQLVMVTVPSRVGVGAYQRLREDLEGAISRVNGRHATVDWTPISYQFKDMPFEELVALYARADVALVTPLRDGMNLVAKEYIASKFERDGVLVLSELAGAADELPEALRVNPYDQGDITAAIETALTMPALEQRRRLITMQYRLSGYTVERWAQDFLEQLATASRNRPTSSAAMMTTTQIGQLHATYRKATKRLIMLDYDGTLKSFVSDPSPQAGQPSQQVMNLLRTLASDPANTIAITSGRTRKALDEWFGELPITLVAEHGAWMRSGSHWQPGAKLSLHWKTQIIDMLSAITERTPGALIEQKHYSVVWHYRNVSPELAFVRQASIKSQAEKILAGSDVGLFEGHKIIEFKSRHVTKGSATKSLVAAGGYNFLLAIGDDYTDEDMFAALPSGAYTIKVGHAASSAKFHLPDVTSVVALLTKLSAFR